MMLAILTGSSFWRKMKESLGGWCLAPDDDDDDNDDDDDKVSI